MAASSGSETGGLFYVHRLGKRSLWGLGLSGIHSTAAGIAGTIGTGESSFLQAFFVPTLQIDQLIAHLAVYLGVFKARVIVCHFQ